MDEETEGHKGEIIILKVMQLLTGEVGIWTLTCWAPNPMYVLYYSVVCYSEKIEGPVCGL